MPISAEDIIPRFFLPQLAALRDVIFQRILPAFDSVEVEADEIEREALERLGERATEHSDDADMAEVAFEAGLEHYDLMTGTQQTLINALTVALSHLFEQQRHLLALRTVVDLEPDSRKRENRFSAFLRANDIERSMFTQHAKLGELDLVANVAKHAEGQSAERLRALRPELLVHPSMRDTSELASPAWPVNRKLMVEELFVAPDDLRAYLDAVESFWHFVLGELPSP